MAENEDWRGQHLIRGLKPKDGRKEATRLVNVIYHGERRKQGVPTAGAKKHSALVASAIRDRDP